MKKILLLVLLFHAAIAFAQPANDNCNNAKQINAQSYCSANAEFSNANATESFIGNGKDIWFKFTAVAFETSITITGNSLVLPRLGIMIDCLGNELVGSTIVDGNTTIFTRGGLTPGRVYYIWVSGKNSNVGTFQLCIKNYNPPVKPGQDFSSASLLCSTNPFPAINITGAGTNNNEASGTCLTVEQNSAWYKWTAANNGTLVFTITPTKFDDIDWVLFDLGIETNPQIPSVQNAIRCAAGHGINNSQCPTEPLYSKTGLDFNAFDNNETGGCGQGQDGVVKFVDLQVGHIYALLIDNFSNGNNGFTLDFTDRSGKPGTGEFAGPKATISIVKNLPCTITQNYIFSSNPTNYATLKWYFGEGASIESADTPGPNTIYYTTPGEKTVVLEVMSNTGCSVVYSESFSVGITPQIPVINGNRQAYCVGDTIELNTPSQPNYTYFWIGPNGFTSTQANIKIPITNLNQAGTYLLTTSLFGCSSSVASTSLSITPSPIALFTTLPMLPAKLSYPVTVEFFNQSKNATTYLWNFGDGNTSIETNPKHEYIADGDYKITLTATLNNACSNSTIRGTYVIRSGNNLFIPNTFTPNGDNINDEFVINITNLISYRITIFNRYGTLLFNTTDIFNNWKGTYKNEPVPVGTYFYNIEGTGTANAKIKKSGSITVLR